MKRGEVWWVDMNPTRGSERRNARPAVVLTIDAVDRARRTVVVVPLSSSPAVHPPVTVAVPGAGPGSVAVRNQVRAADKSRFDWQHGKLSQADLKAVEAGVRTVLGL